MRLRKVRVVLMLSELVEITYTYATANYQCCVRKQGHVVLQTKL